MDDHGFDAYVARAMNLLLLFSALVSALTGAGMGARRPEVAQAVAAQAVAAQPMRTATVRTAQRPVAALPTLAALGSIGVADAPVILQAVDLWASRRRE